MKKLLFILLFILPFIGFSQQLPEKDPSDENVFIAVEVMPEFPGGTTAMMEYLSKSVKYPSDALAVKITGKVYVSFVINENGKETVKQIDLNAKHEFDLDKLYLSMQEIKKSYPQVFKIEFNPSDSVAYKDIVKLMDEVRKSKSADVRFPVKDEKTGEMTSTEYMFPEVVFSNMLEG